MRRKGRPARAQARRRITPSQRPPAENCGPTPEARARKAMLLGMEITDGAVLKQPATCCLEVMASHGLIDEATRDAGLNFAWLYWRHIGKTWARTGNLSDRISRGSIPVLPDIDPETDAALEARFNELHSMLTAMGNEKYNAFCDAVITPESFPTWVLQFVVAAKPSRQIDALMEGLDILTGMNRRYRRAA